jgi:16S rRNA (guanine1207-N2)-methyltransferase
VATEHYFSRHPASSDERTPLSVRLAGRLLTLETAPGVFSSRRLDPGTSVLLDGLDPPSTGSILDLGCGWGAIAIASALLSPDATVWAVDVNERARDLTRRNADAVAREHPLGRIEVAAPEDVPSDLLFDAIYSNPPIRIGKDALHGLLAQWLPRLVSGASSRLVVQRNLGADSLAAWLAAQTDDAGVSWGAVTREASSKGYRVLRLTRG